MSSSSSSSYPLMETVSGVRGIAGKSLSPSLVVAYAQAFAVLQKEEHCSSSSKDGGSRPLIVVGRDSRVSGPWVMQVVIGTLRAYGVDVVDVGIVPTPTVQYITMQEASGGCIGGIVVTSSHNPVEWNGLKFVDKDGLFVSPSKVKRLIEMRRGEAAEGALYDKMGHHIVSSDACDRHITSILSLPFIDVELVKKRKFRVCLDTVNGAGGTIMQMLMERFGCEVIGLNVDETGVFAHTPEPVTSNLSQLMQSVKDEKADVGIAVDPDVDRCVLIDERGLPLGEEYTLSLAVEFLLGSCGKRGNVVKNLSTTRVIDEVAHKYGCDVFASAVGEINVAMLMQEKDAVIGGEGNGGVMLPDIHIGRDAPVAAALVLQLLSRFDGTLSELKATLPQYEICKLKAPIGGIDPKQVVEHFRNEWTGKAEISEVDGIRIDTPQFWVHLRESNTEPIIRVIGEASATTDETAEDASRKMCERFMNEIEGLKRGEKRKREED